VQKKPHTVDVGILIEVVDALGIKGGRSPNDAMHLIAFIKQQFRKIRTVLPSNTSNKSFFHISPKKI
jgi:phosphoheptose isomerase